MRSKALSKLYNSGCNLFGIFSMASVFIKFIVSFRLFFLGSFHAFIYAIIHWFFVCGGKRAHLLQPPTLLPPKQAQLEQVIQDSVLLASEYLKI